MRDFALCFFINQSLLYPLGLTDTNQPLSWFLFIFRHLVTFLVALLLFGWNGTVRKFNWWLYCLALWNEIFYYFPLFYEILRHTELCNSVISHILYSEIRKTFSNSVVLIKHEFFFILTVTKSFKMFTNIFAFKNLYKVLSDVVWKLRCRYLKNFETLETLSLTQYICDNNDKCLKCRNRRIHFHG